MIKLVYFASVRERLGIGEESLELPAGVEAVRDVMQVLQARGEPWASVIGESNLLVAVNQQMSAPETPVSTGDEVAFFPPVTGG